MNIRRSVREGIALRTVFLLKLGREIFCTQEQIQATLRFAEHAFDILTGFRINRSGASAVARRDFEVIFVIASAFVAVDKQPVREIVFHDRFGIERSNFESVRLIVNDLAYIAVDPILGPIRGRTSEHRVNARLSAISIRDELFPFVARWNVVRVILPAKLLVAPFLWMLMFVPEANGVAKFMLHDRTQIVGGIGREALEIHRWLVRQIGLAPDAFISKR